MSDLQWSLSTLHSSYTVSLSDDLSQLLLDGWGPRSQIPPLPWSHRHHTVQHIAATDGVPTQLGSAGSRHASFSELIVDRGQGGFGAQWRAEPDRIQFTSRPDGDELTVPFVDETGTLALSLHTKTSSEHDLVHRWIRVENSEAGRTVFLERAFSAGWNIPVGTSARVEYLAGAWASEFGRYDLELRRGAFAIGSREGRTGHGYAPLVTVQALDDPSQLPRRRDFAFGVGLEWSGSWTLRVESSALEPSVRVSCGVDDELTRIALEPGEAFESPKSFGIWAADGSAGVSRALHRYQRSLSRSHDATFRPIVYNSWYATEFDVREEHQLALARVAKTIGAEVFVVDDGWFAGRTSDRSGLGDWDVDTVKFPRHLDGFAAELAAIGLDFGLWIEPEAVTEDSTVYRQHPDWILHDEHRAPIKSRNQYVLDFGRDDVVDYVMDRLRSVLRSAPIVYLKWDQNRILTDGSRAGELHGREWSLRHTRGYYRVMDMIRTEFPHVAVEACAGGGGRIDHEVIRRSDTVWVSDEIGPLDRLTIQDGFLRAYAPHLMDSWVGDERGLSRRRDVSLEWRFAVAMCGVLGIGSDLLEWSDAEVTRARELVELYKSMRDVIFTADVYTHGVPGEVGYAVEYVHRGSGQAIVFCFDSDRNREYDPDPVRVFPQGLEPDRAYRVQASGDVITGATASSVGIVVPFALARDVDILRLTAVADG